LRKWTTPASVPPANSRQPCAPASPPARRKSTPRNARLPDSNVLKQEAAPGLTWQEKFAAAEALFAAGAFAEAEAEYAAVIAAAPSHLPANIGAAKCARKRGDNATSLGYFTAAAAAWPTHPGVHKERAADLKALKRYEEAEDAYRRVIELAPEHSPDSNYALLNLGECAKLRGDRAAALAFYQAAAEADPTNPWPLAEIAGEHRAAGRWKDAEAAYAKCLVIAPDNVNAWLGLGHCARRHSKALSFAIFQAGAQAAPANPWPLLEAAADLRDLGRFKDAETICARALEIAPGNAQAHLGLAKCARKRGDREASILHIRAASLAAPTDPWPLLELAADLRELGRLEEAEAHGRRALEIAPSQPVAHIGLAQCARARGNRAAALQILTAAAAALPHDSGLRLERAAELRHFGQLDAAEAECRHVLATQPENLHAHLGLGHAARKRGDRYAAMEFYRAAIRAAPSEPWPRMELAADLRAIQEIAQAEAMYQEVLAMLPGNAHALLGLGFCARARGDRAAALAAFEAATRADPADAAPWLEIAVEQREAGESDAAIATAQAVLARHPTNLIAMMSIALSERHAARHEAAFAAFSAAHQAHPAHAEPLVEMAVSARTLGRQAECDALLARALAADPRNVSAIVRLAEQAMAAQNIDHALEIYRHAAAEQPGELAFHLGIAEALAGQGQIDDAVATLEALQAERGPMPPIICKRISLLRQTGDYRAALSLGRETAAADPANFQLWSELFHTAMLAGTAQDIQACLASAPAHTAHHKAALRRHQGQFAESQWRYSEALADYEAAAEANPNDAALQQDMVRLKTLLLDLQGAGQHLRKFCELTAYATRLRKKSLNVSQTHFGQILDEYRLDDAVAAVKPLLALPPAAQLAPLTGFVRARPDSTLAAVALMVALRQAGLFSSRPDGGGGIPRRITQFWDSEAPPEDVGRLMRSWRENNPGYEWQLFNEDGAREFLAARFPEAVVLAFSRVREPAQKADIFRLAVLAAEGGVYADADDRCLQPIDSIVPGTAELLMYQEDHGTIGNNFLAARPGHPVMVRALQMAVAAVNRGDSDILWLATGPALLTRAFGHFLARSTAAVAVPPGVVVLDRRELFQAVAIHCGAGYKRTEKHWSNTAFARRRTTKPAATDGTA
jgi:tetratricopeptide (TPR) repeat protein